MLEALVEVSIDGLSQRLQRRVVEALRKVVTLFSTFAERAGNQYFSGSAREVNVVSQTKGFDVSGTACVWPSRRIIQSMHA